jgi:pimeloyl-ACP methyl ester carboxylesterase
LLHGGTGSWLHWVRNVEPLARDFRVLVPDLPGSGESASPPPPISAHGIARSISSGIASIIGEQTPFGIAGFSMGGLIAGYVANQSAPRAHHLILVGSSGMESARSPMAPLVSWRRLATEEEKLATHRKNLSILMIHDPGRIDSLAIHAQARNAMTSRVRGKHVSHTGALSQCLPGFSGRIAGIWGEHDPTAAPHFGERRDRLKQFRADASFELVPGVGHWVQYEAHEWFNKRVPELMTA